MSGLNLLFRLNLCFGVRFSLKTVPFRFLSSEKKTEKLQEHLATCFKIRKISTETSAHARNLFIIIYYYYLSFSLIYYLHRLMMSIPDYLRLLLDNSSASSVKTNKQTLIITGSNFQLHTLPTLQLHLYEKNLLRQTDL